GECRSGQPCGRDQPNPECCCNDEATHLVLLRLSMPQTSCASTVARRPDCRGSKAARNGVFQSQENHRVTTTLERYQRIAPFYDLLDVPFDPRGARVLGIDFSPAMLARAARRSARAGAALELRQMDVTQLDLPTASFDAAVATFLFCVLANDLQVRALRELGRVVRPGGT